MAAKSGGARRGGGTRLGTVRQHYRRTADGRMTTVRQHSRAGTRKRRGLVSPRHAWKLAVRAFRAGRRGRKAAAFALGGLAVGELAAWSALRGAGLMLATAGALAVGVGMLAMMATGGDG
jgi:hypothetical protein